ncbi:MAG: DUF4426 domain-containing protein [Vreelandella alkaliphila]|uniref:DUF4426 domain-containing protein n=1 Tax=Halomonas campaniensis TaxID=213554 RepID=A0A3D0KAQ1_9GAMM|nr:MULTISPECIES: DUF4426 domain-containing protein [unclassified Halomonas]HBP41855.1 DUF4426 domain-containing protein [Halomonas sp.]HBS82304.1 DUF4426 domain-containing protein [Halomonas campaniensis]ASK20735.1 hypothetical protein CEK60_16175 [Halomonas sp. N3-2A]UTD57334.1 DUF4426 domain-containing protein [Halomonas sp. MS1]HCA00622.1 DUF4426 domain-containing protein [Halomonas campaniensis]
MVYRALRRTTLLTTLLCSLLLATQAVAEQLVRIGDYEIHYSAVATSFLTPEVAQAHGIQRSAGLGLVNVSVRERQEDGSTRAVNASVQGHVTGLTDAQESLSFRTVHDGDATYHLATFALRHDEPTRFNLDVRYDRNASPERVSFIQRFYIER